ncbi:FadR/GntR family transcriptional regulator [Algirhabdus cladophorae]|uniref:FadR/GntR family transcriptional regulator n=1 Tax=Algirhabdus cladophorae TaxID=3377108 RepID=UPI003B845E61
MNEEMFYSLKGSNRMPASMATRVASALGRQIVGQSYPCGGLIEDEAALSVKYDVSRSVVRDAVKILVGKGLLEVRRGVGTRVLDRRKWGLLDDDVLAWHQEADLSEDYLGQLLDVRMMIEPKAARWAAERGSDVEHAKIEAAQLQMEAEQTDLHAFVAADAAFHSAILFASNNEFLRSMEGVMISALMISIRLTTANLQDKQQVIPFHRGVTDAILQRNGALAETKMENHLEDTKARLGHVLGLNPILPKTH